MIIDFHTHIFPEKVADKALSKLAGECKLSPFTMGTENSLIESMKEAGVTTSVVLPVATNPLKCQSMNNWAREINSHQNGLLSFAAIHPDAPNLKQLVKEIAEAGFKGIKIHPDYQQVFINDKRFLTIIEEAESFGLVTVTHAGLDYGYLSEIHCSPYRILDVVNLIHPKKFVIAHMGGNALWYDVENTLCGKGLYFDTAFVHGRISQEQLLRLILLNGADKILFATDSPWNSQKDDVEFYKNLPLPQNQKDLIFYENARRLLEL